MASGVADHAAAGWTDRTAPRRVPQGCTGTPRADGALVMEHLIRERCAAYVATRGALEAVQRAATSWPDELAVPACTAAMASLHAMADSLDQPAASAARRRCVRDALVIALGVAAACDVAHALGHQGDALAEAQRAASRAISMLGMFLHASTHVIAD
jgi:hypothetical protein